MFRLIVPFAVGIITAISFGNNDFFQIQTDEEVSVGDGQGEEVWAYDGSVLDNDEDIKEVVIEYKEWEEKKTEDR